ncbi:dual specificity protein phosphatase 12 [Xylona heveae TC161]|uniref:protein-tyrosine-phosphatase n=1 Tax=Xylona heveae (strain CBS 132557 / TC161) TaxID=1328760 RepID=A0A165FY65_XYLHT|nr:dual specificity protein phosphatase 12 [Xylona heveae TC161]KZF21524.1 dual specificity protein phosphatase 12 [Xylona heveae TC161]
MALLDRIPGDDNIYIGGIFSLRRREALKEANITHVVSVLRMPLEEALFQPYKHHVVEVDDIEDENLLEHFEATNKFIQDGLDAGGGVLVHCAMGKSRSATCAAAFLMAKYHISPYEALGQIRRGRPMCEPNQGFMAQLEIYDKMNTPENVAENPIYQRWLYKKEVELSLASGRAPEDIRFEDEQTPKEGEDPAQFDLRCRKCRRALATSHFVVAHEPKSGAATSCAHYFLDPLSWMRSELEQGKLDGRLECPKCKTNVGKYAWQGMQCSCGEWIVPGISLARGRVDEAKIRNIPAGAVGGIRLPPGASKDGHS